MKKADFDFVVQDKQNRPFKEIGRGSFGRVYAPAFKCITAPAWADRAYVSKLLVNKEAAEQELKNSMLLGLQRIDPTTNYFIGTAEKCDLAVQEKERVTPWIRMFAIAPDFVLNYLYGGTSMAKLLSHKDELSSKGGRALLRAMENVFEGVALLHDHGIYHMDIKEDNLVVEGSKTGLHIRLIDFGASVTTRNPPTQLVGTLLYIPFEMNFIQSTPGTERVYQLFTSYHFLPPLAKQGLTFQPDEFPKWSDLNDLTLEEKYTKADVWALGIVLQKILLVLPKVYQEIMLKLKTLIKKLLTIKVQDRPSANEALQLYRAFIQEVFPQQRREPKGPKGGRKGRKGAERAERGLKGPKGG